MTAPYQHLFAQPVKASPYASLYGPSSSGDVDLCDGFGGHGSSGEWSDEAEPPGVVAQVKEGASQAYQGVRHLPSTLAGMGKSALHDLDVVGRLVSGGTGGPTEGVEKLSGGEMARAGVNTAANILLPYAGVMGVEARLGTNATLGAINDPDQPIRGASAGVLTGEVLHGGAKAAGKIRAAKSTPIAETVAEAPKVEASAPTDADLAAAGPQERNLGFSIGTKARDAIRTAYRSAMVTPYANIEAQAPALSDALLTAGAAKARAQHIGTTRIGRVMNGLTEEQQGQFGTKLVYDNLVAEAERKGVAAQQATDPVQAAELATAAQNFEAHAKKIEPQVLPGIEQTPWFQKSLAQYKTDIEGPLTKDAIASGVDPNSLRAPASAYVRLASDARLNDAEIRRALDVAGVSDVSQLNPRAPWVKKLIGENPALSRYFARNAPGPRQGPLQANAGYPGEPGPVSGKRVGVSGSSNMAQGTAADYTTDLSRIVDFDARDKAIKASRNRVLSEVANAGRLLDEGDAPAPGKKVLSFDDKKGLVDGDNGLHRYEVTPEVHDAVTRFYQGNAPPSTARASLQKASDFFTRAQIAGMPVEATSHANTLASLVGSVPGEKDVIGNAIATIPGIGGKAASIREMMGVNFDDPKIQALENRLADIGALRVSDVHSGLINKSHNFLFGPRGVDPRARLVLARKFLDRAPEATDAQLREFITSQTGNYNAQNAGALPNFMAKGSVLSPFARFQSARIPTSIKRTVGESSLPTTSKLQRAGDVARTLYRGPIGHIVGAGALNYALTGHGTQDNESGHALDVNTGFYAVPGGIKHMSPQQAEAYGDKASPIYIPAATLNPVAYAGLRATGLRALIPGLSPEQPNESRLGNAVRDQTNVALGTAGPLMRGMQTALTGTQPYLQPDNTFLRVAPKRFGATSELKGQIETALGLMNPAVHAFSASGGDASRTLAGAMAEDGKFMGGPASIAAKVAEFTMPRVLAPAVGGKSNEQSMETQMDRRYRDALTDYSSRIKRAPGPVAQQAIIDEARNDASRNGFDPDAVVVALEKVQAQDQQSVAERRNNNRDRHILKIRKP